MIVTVVCLTVVVVASLWTANAIHRREVELDREEESRTPEAVAVKRAAIAEKRAILLKRRGGLFTDVNAKNGKPLASGANVEKIDEIDSQLLKLADEEGRLYASTK